MKPTDIILKEVTVRFTSEKMLPFQLSSGSSTQATYASVRVTVENRRGQVAQGCGGIFLSQLWSYPSPDMTVNERDTAMRNLVGEIRDLLLTIDHHGDPLQIPQWFERQLPQLTEKVERERCLRSPIPKLAGVVCWSPFDAAIHDAWAKACGKSAYDMYSAQFLNNDLGFYLGEEWKGLYPGHFLVNQKAELPVQHVVGISDRLTQGEGKEVANEAKNAFPASLDEWIRRDGVNCFKLKLKGIDVEWDLQRIIEVDRVARETLADMQEAESIHIALDPNTACPHPDLMVELLEKLREKDERLYDSITYIEQPTQRNLAAYPYTLHEVSRRKPVLLDESLDSLDSLQYIGSLGWSGVALKTCKGQSAALLSYCWARQRNLFITVQDLTNCGFAYVQSANLSGHLALSSDAFECNSRQYAPHSCAEETAQYPEMFVAKAGRISLNQIRGLGLY